MPATTGRYATRSVDTLASRINHHWRWLLNAAIRITGRGRLDERDNGGGYTLFAVLNPDNSFTESDAANDANNLALSTQQTLVSGPVEELPRRPLHEVAPGGVAGEDVEGALGSLEARTHPGASLVRRAATGPAPRETGWWPARRRGS